MDLSRLSTNEKIDCGQLSVLYQSRFCKKHTVDLILYQEYFENIFIDKYLNFDGVNFDRVKQIALLEPKIIFAYFFIGSDIYLVNKGCGRDDFCSVDVFTEEKRKWKTVTTLPVNYHYGCCFMQHLYVTSENGLHMKYDIVNNKWCNFASINQPRYYPACTVYQGKIVVSGGRPSDVEYYQLSKSVEAYDHHINQWSPLPDMIERKSHHSAVSIGNKLFVIGGLDHTIEVFDCISQKFTLLSKGNRIFYYPISAAVSVGSKIVLLKYYPDEVGDFVVYDVDENNLSLQSINF